MVELLWLSRVAGCLMMRLKFEAIFTSMRDHLCILSLLSIRSVETVLFDTTIQWLSGFNRTLRNF